MCGPQVSGEFFVIWEDQDDAKIRKQYQLTPGMYPGFLLTNTKFNLHRDLKTGAVDLLTPVGIWNRNAFRI